MCVAVMAPVIRSILRIGGTGNARRPKEMQKSLVVKWLKNLSRLETLRPEGTDPRVGRRAGASHHLAPREFHPPCPGAAAHRIIFAAVLCLPMVFPADIAGKILCKKCLILLKQTTKTRAQYAVPPKADICGARANVRFGPKADISEHAPKLSYLFFVGRAASPRTCRRCQAHLHYRTTWQACLGNAGGR